MNMQGSPVLGNTESKELKTGLTNLPPEQIEAVQRIETWLQLEQQQRQIFMNDDRIEAVEELGGGRCQYAYDSRGNLTQIIEANDKRTTYEYDEQHRLVRVVHVDGTTTEYRYGESDRLIQISDRGVLSQFDHDELGRLSKIQRGNAGASVYRYDALGHVVEARTSVVSTQQEYDNAGRIRAICQTLNGVALHLQLEYDSAGRLMNMVLPGSTCAIRYQWNNRGWPQTVSLGDRLVARFEYGEEQKTSRIHFANGIVEETKADPVDCRPVQRQLCKGNQILWQRDYQYSAAGQIVSDGTRHYAYDSLGRLTEAADLTDGSHWGFSYDPLDNCISREDTSGAYQYHYDVDNRLEQIQLRDRRGASHFCKNTWRLEIARQQTKSAFADSIEPAKAGFVCVAPDFQSVGDLLLLDAPDRSSIQLAYDPFGRLIRKTHSQGEWTYRYNDASQLLQVRDRGNTVARFIYDHKGRLVLAQWVDRVERYLYGPTDELLAVTDDQGNPLRLYVRTPLGLLAEIHGSLETGAIYYRHHDDQGTCHRVTDQGGNEVAQFVYSPFGIPSTSSNFQAIFTGRIWHPDIQMYQFGARWYDPDLARFLTPDSYTGAPDDERLVNPLGAASRQWLCRGSILTDWLKQPRVRNPYAYCSNDPLNRVDPNGHWSFGGVLLMLLGAIWTLPNTLFGLLIEITCLIGEVIRWIVWLVTAGNVTWETPGFDAAASGRLNAFALVFKGGWLGSFQNLLGITFGNVFFVYKKWEDNPEYGGPGDVFPAAYHGTVSIPRRDALYEHELRHTNQYGWFGPFFHLGLPIWGVYLWDVILNGYYNAWLERDAREYGGV